MSEILGVLFAIFVGIMVIPKFADYQTASNNNTRLAVTAQQQKQLNAAATTYAQQNSVAIQAVATATTPAVITVAMLQAAGNLLPASFSATNPFGQTWQVEVLQPTAGNLQALAMSTGGTALSDVQATKVATIVGATGGFIPQNDSGLYPGAAANAYGAFAGWTIPTTNYTSVTGGHPAALLTFNNGQLTDNRLYRNLIPGQSQLNTMNTPLIMGAGTVQTSGGACAATDLGTLARDSGGKVLMCDGSNWKQQGSAFWGDPVQRVTDPDGAGGITGLSTTTCNASLAGQVRMVLQNAAGTTLTPPRDYACDGSAWKPVGIDDQGLLMIPGVVTEGAACPNGEADNGRVGRDATGLLLSCQSGIWRKASGSVAGVKAWVNFNGLAGNCPGNWCLIRSQYNVSGVWRNGSGVYTIYFSTAMPDTNYALAAGGTFRSAAYRSTHLTMPDNYVPTTTSVVITAFEANSGLVDAQYATAAFFSN